MATARSTAGPVVAVTELAGADERSREVQVVVIGPLSEPECDELRPKLLGLAATCQRMVLDLSEVTLVAAAGFSLLLSLHQTLWSAGSELVLGDVSPVVRRVLDILRWDEVVEVMTGWGDR